MFKHILVPTDGSKLSAKAERAAIKLAAATGARVTALRVLPQTVYDVAGDAVVTRVLPPKEARRIERNVAPTLFRRLQHGAALAKVGCTAQCVTDDDAWLGIVGAARRSHCDLIVMASHGRRGIAGVLLGSVAQKVLTHSSIPVLIYR
jgi:nucleotide-binding universal stress UspA family protein